jgi:hypothetical protein
VVTTPANYNNILLPTSGQQWQNVGGGYSNTNCLFVSNIAAFQTDKVGDLLINGVEKGGNASPGNSVSGLEKKDNGYYIQRKGNTWTSGESFTPAASLPSSCP